MTFELLVVDVLGLGLLVDFLQVLVDGADPLAGVSFSIPASLLGIAGKSTLAGKGVRSSLLTFSIGFTGGFSDDLGVGVKVVHGSLVDKWVLLLDFVVSD